MHPILVTVPLVVFFNLKITTMNIEEAKIGSKLFLVHKKATANVSGKITVGKLFTFEILENKVEPVIIIGKSEVHAKNYYVFDKQEDAIKQLKKLCK